MAATLNLGYVSGISLDLSLFTTDQITAAETLVLEFIQNQSPVLEVGKGSTFFDIIIRLRALHALIRQQLDQAREQTTSLLAVTQNPALASAPVVDAILSNFGISRNLGSQATGTVQVNVTSNSLIYSIPAGTALTTSNGVVFNPQTSYRATSSPASATDLQLYATDASNTQFYFLLPVVAAVNGVASRIGDMTQLSLAPSIPNFINAQAFGNFQGGADDESNADLLARQPNALAAKNCVSRVSISSTLKGQFPFIQAVSVQGMNDPAMRRNSKNLLSFKLGGYVDIYVRTAQAPSLGSITKTATLVGITGTSYATYSITINPGDFPGNYFVNKINGLNGNFVSSYSITQETKTAVAPLTGQIHLLPTNQDAVYTQFQASTVLFQIDYDSSLNTSPANQFLETISVSVQVSYMPGIADIQGFVSDPNRGPVLADYLVKAGIPCFVQISPLQVTAAAGTSGADIQAAIYQYINTLPFRSALRVDQIISVAKSIAGVKTVDLPVQLVGNIYAPDGTTQTIRSTNFLTIPSLPNILVNPDTVIFVAELADIPISMVFA